MVKVVVIDDEQDGREYLVNCLNSMDGVVFTGQAEGLESGMELIIKEQPNVVLLDIQMRDGTGFDLLDRINEVDFNVIFTTSYDSYTLKAIKYNALDYLLKPIDPEELEMAIEKVKSKDDQDVLIENLIKSLKGQVSNQRIALYTNNCYEFVDADEIVSIQSENKYCHVSTKAKTMFVSKSIKEFEELLDPVKFIRVHREYIINSSFVRSYNKNDGGTLILDTEEAIPIARRKKQLVEELLLK